MRKGIHNIFITGLIILILSLCKLIIGCSAAPKVESIPITSNIEEKKVIFNLEGRWKYPTQQGGLIVEVIQEGFDIKGYWRLLSDDYPTRCKKDTIWFEGRIKGDEALGVRYLCPQGTDPLYIKILEGGNLLSVEIKMSGSKRGDLQFRKIK